MADEKHNIGKSIMKKDSNLTTKKPGNGGDKLRQSLNPQVTVPGRSEKALARRTAILEKLKPVDFISGKPVFVVPSTTVLNLKSGFSHKLLCDGFTFTAGSACAFSCTFCYVTTLLLKNKWIQQILKQTGLEFSDIVVRRQSPMEQLRKQLTPRGKAKYLDPADTRVIYASPLVDIAANMELVNETAQMCLAILELTHWQIRLLSKSPLIAKIANLIPDRFQHRMIYGLSTGTLDDGVAKAIEQGTGLVSKRLAALHTLQDRGLRTFGMVCPILPQADPAAYAARLAEAIRVDRCEDVWAEVVNVRGPSFTATHDALRIAGYHEQAELLAQVSHNTDRREQYSRNTFLAFTKVVPAKKFHFLQYVTRDTAGWWRDHQHLGAVLLGSSAGSAATSRRAA